MKRLDRNGFEIEPSTSEVCKCLPEECQHVLKAAILFSIHFETRQSGLM